jgi:nucleotide-binding universal stress UspA family protein
MSRFHRILVPIDFSEHADAAFQRALAIARAGGAELHLLHAYEVPYGTLPTYSVELPMALLASVRDAAARRIEKCRATAQESGVACQTHLCADVPATAIFQTATEVRADLIVMGTRGLSGLKHVLLGSTAERTVRTAPCPVLTVKAGAAARASDAAIVVAVDFSNRDEEVLALALQLAQESHGRLHLVHAYEVPTTMTAAYGISIPQQLWDEVQEAANARMTELADRAKSASVPVTVHLATAPASDAILDVAAAQHADLIVIGTRGRTGLEHLLLGSVAERTVRLAACPVLTMRCA